jgi:hypothetical protein
MEIIKTVSELKVEVIRDLYDKFDSPIARLDCGKKCAPHNSSGKPFCCDICHAVPAAYKSEWNYLQPNTDLWHVYRGDECGSENKSAAKKLKADTPKSMLLLLACLGPDQCQRDFRALSCRQFPFFPYVTSDYRFPGLAYEWEFESRCWVVSNLSHVTQKYREEFVGTFDKLFSLFQDEFDNYAFHSEKLREYYAKKKRRFTLLHRNGKAYLVSPRNERMTKMDIEKLPKFGFYK